MPAATSFRTDPEKIETLDSLAKRFIREVMDGIAEAERGEFATEDEVAAVFKKYGA